MSQNNRYPRCKFHADGRIQRIEESEEPFFQEPEWFNHPCDVPPPPAKPAEGCPNCLALVAEAEAKFAKFDQAWAEKTEECRKLIEENAALRILADKAKGAGDVNTKLSAENSKLRAQIQKAADKPKAEKPAEK